MSACSTRPTDSRHLLLSDPSNFLPFLCVCGDIVLYELHFCASYSHCILFVQTALQFHARPVLQRRHPISSPEHGSFESL